MPAPPTVQVVSSRFVTIELAAAMTGFSPAAIRAKINKGVWIEERQWIKREGRVLIDMRGYEKWVESGTA
ncbi:excisionase [Paracidovorax avenae]|nr:excisionase [Paracidovorax avenae]